MLNDFKRALARVQSDFAFFVTDDTVAVIANDIGYRSEYSFSRAFTRHRGLAPGRYRRQARVRTLAAA